MNYKFLFQACLWILLTGAGKAQTPIIFHQTCVLPAPTVYEREQKLHIEVKSNETPQLSIKINQKTVINAILPKTQKDHIYHFEPIVTLPALWDTPIKLEIIVINTTKISESASLDAYTMLKKRDSGVQLRWNTPNQFEWLHQKMVLDTSETTVVFEVSSNTALTEANMQLLVNGLRYTPKIGEGELTVTTGIYHYFYTKKVFFEKEGHYELALQVILNGQLVNTSETLHFEYKTLNTKQLRLFCVGVPADNLKFTEKDAHDFKTVFESQEGVYYDKVTSKLLTGEATTRSHVINELVSIRDAYGKTLTEKDVLILFFSAHGDTVNGKYYLKLHQFNRKAPDDTGLCWDLFEKYLGSSIQCKKILFLDACRSGTIQADSKASKTLVETQKLSQAGWMIITSSLSELSWEDARWQNGTFTEALLEGLQGEKANFDGNQWITLSEIAQYLQQRMPELGKLIEGKDHNGNKMEKIQRPQFINLSPMFPIFKGQPMKLTNPHSKKN